MMRMRLKRVSVKILGAALFILAVTPPCVRAATPTTLAQYRQHIREAFAPLDALAKSCEEAATRKETHAPGDADTNPSVSLSQAETKMGRDVRRLLPPTMKVEWDGEILDVNNEWLHASLEEYQKRAAGSSDYRERAATVRGMAGRLRALDERLAEIETSGKNAPARDKEAEKGRLAAILRNPEFHRQASHGGALASLLEQIVEWIRNLFPNIRPLDPRASPGLSRAAQIFIFALTFGVVAFLLRRYWQKHGGKLKRRTIRDARVVLGEHLAPDETAADLLAASEQLARSGDLRGAIRKAYVALLCELGDRQIIRLSQHKTNRDYLQAVRLLPTPQLYQEMQPLTFNFERHWYGFEPATETDWTNFRARCRQILTME